MTLIHVARAAAVKRVQAVAEDAAGIDTPAEVGLGRTDAVTVITCRDLVESGLGGPLGHEVEHTGRVGRTVERGGESVHHLDQKKKHQHKDDQKKQGHTVQAGILKVASLE